MTIAGSIAYGALVFLAMAALGFVVLPAVGLATGLFVIDAEARAFFSCSRSSPSRISSP